MARQYEEAAIGALVDVLSSSQFTDQLRAVEADRGLTAGSLTDPRAVIDAFVPNDNRSPLVQVYAEGGEIVDQVQGLYACNAVVAVSYTGGTNMVASEQFMRRYLSALINTIRTNPLLRSPTLLDAPQVVGALLGPDDRVIFGDDSATRHHKGLAVQVRVHTP